MSKIPLLPSYSDNKIYSKAKNHNYELQSSFANRFCLSQMSHFPVSQNISHFSSITGESRACQNKQETGAASKGKALFRRCMLSLALHPCMCMIIWLINSM